MSGRELMTDKIGHGLTIFILDDEKDICQFSKRFFEKRGFKVHTAEDLASALNIIKNEKIDIALLDVHIGKASGIDVLKMILEKQALCQCVMLTRDDNKEIMEASSKIGAVDYLIKPLTLDKIESAVSKIVKRIGKGKG